MSCSDLLSLFVINLPDRFVEDYGDREYVHLGIDTRCVPLYGQIPSFYAVIRYLSHSPSALLGMYAEMCVGLLPWDQTLHNAIQNLVLHFAWTSYANTSLSNELKKYNFPLVCEFERRFVERYPRYGKALLLRRNITQSMFVHKMWWAKQGRSRL